MPKRYWLYVGVLVGTVLAGATSAQAPKPVFDAGSVPEIIRALRATARDSGTAMTSVSVSFWGDGKVSVSVRVQGESFTGFGDDLEGAVIRLEGKLRLASGDAKSNADNLRTIINQTKGSQ